MPQTATRRAERRDHVRADAQLSMRLGAGSETAPEIVTETQNISASGLYCLSPHYLAPLSKVDLTLVLPDGGRRATGRLLQCEAVVVRCQAAADRRRRYELACSFIGLPEDQRRVLAEFVALRNLKTLSESANGRRTTRRRATRASATKRSATTRPRRTAAAKRAGTTRPATRTAARKRATRRRA
jgi:hypothetical protein